MYFLYFDDTPSKSESKSEAEKVSGISLLELSGSGSLCALEALPAQLDFPENICFFSFLLSVALYYYLQT